MFFFNGRVAETAPNVIGWLDVQLRRGDAGTQILLRPALGYQLAQDLQVHLGYLYVPNLFDAGTPTRHEHRVWQQANWYPRLGELRTLIRPRLEQRFVAGEAGVGLRARLLLRGMLPLFAPVSGIVWDEAFVHLNAVAWGPRPGFDQNRAFAGLGLDAFPGARLEVGYLNQWVRRSDAPDLLNHAFFAALFLWR